MTSRNAPFRVEVKPTFVTFTHMIMGNSSSLVRETMSFADIAKIELLSKKGTKYDVEIRDAQGVRLFRYPAKDEARAREFIDVLSALIAGDSKAPIREAAQSI